MATNTPSKKLYDLLVTKNYPDLEFYDTKTGQPPVEGIADADLFTFKWTPGSGKNYGTATILFGDENNLKFYFGDNLARGIEDPADKQELYDFQHQLKQFATAHRLDFDLDDISKLKYALAGQAKMTESIFEGWNGTKTTSWTDRPDAVRLMIRHQRPLGEGDARHRYIESLFVETTDGERYKLPFKKLAGGRAMVEHVRQGGRPYDPRGQHISEMVEELNVLSRFRRANHGRIFEGEASGRGYQSYFESWNPAAITEQNIMIDDIKKMFVEQSIDSRIEQALPMLVKIKQGHDMKQADIFEAWVDEITGGEQSSDNLLHTEEQQDKLVELLSKKLRVGAYAADAEPVMKLLVNAPKDWLDQLDNELKQLAKTNPDADAAPIIMALLQELDSDTNITSVLDRIGVDADEPDQEPAEEPDQEPMPTVEGAADEPVDQDPNADDKRFDDIDEDIGSMSRIMELAGLGESDRNEISVKHVRGNEFTVTANGQQYSVTADAERDGNEYDDPCYWANVQIIDATGQPMEDPSFQDEVLTYLDTQYGDIASEEVTDTDISRADDVRDRIADRDMENEGMAGAALGGIAGGALTKTPSGVLSGAKLGSEIQDAFSNKEEATEGIAGAAGGAILGGMALGPLGALGGGLLGSEVDEGACNECGMYGMHESNCSMDEQVMLEGKFKEMSMDLEALSDAEFENKYDMTKTEAQDKSSIEPDKVQEDSLIRMRQLSGILIR